MKRLLKFAFTVSVLFGCAGTSSASTCAISYVIIADQDATSCGSTLTSNDYLGRTPDDWSVNLDDAGSLGEEFNWLAYMKVEVTEGEIIDGVETAGVPIATLSSWSYEENGQLDGSKIGLQFTAYTGVCDTVHDPECVPDYYSSGEFILNVGDEGKLLIVMKGGASNYHWYYFEDLTPGLQSGGLWNTDQAFGGKNLGHMTAYTTSFTAIPVPPAIWLFGSGLIGLIGIARKKTV